MSETAAAKSQPNEEQQSFFFAKTQWSSEEEILEGLEIGAEYYWKFGVSLGGGGMAIENTVVLVGATYDENKPHPWALAVRKTASSAFPEEKTIYRAYPNELLKA